MLYAEENNSNVHIVFQQSLQLKIKEYDDGLSLKITKTRETCIDMDFIVRKIRFESVISSQICSQIIVRHNFMNYFYIAYALDVE